MSNALEGLLERLQGATFIVSQPHKVQMMNRRAEALAADGSLVRIGVDSRLTLSVGAANEQLLRALRDCFDNGTSAGSDFSALIARADGRTAELCVLPLAALVPGSIATSERLALVNLCFPEERTANEDQLLMRRYGLSPAEAAVTRKFVGGASLQEIAEGSGVKYTTVRNQLSSAKQKIGVHRQSELILKVGELSPRLLLNQPPANESGGA